MNKSINLNSKKEIKDPFLWKDRKNNFHDIKKMHTRHLFYTLRMIWNHRMPEEARIYPFHHHGFGSFYSNEYFIQAIQSIYPELKDRNDLYPDQQKELIIMEKWFTTHRINLDGEVVG